MLYSKKVDFGSVPEIKELHALESMLGESSWCMWWCQQPTYKLGNRTTPGSYELLGCWAFEGFRGATHIQIRAPDEILPHPFHFAYSVHLFCPSGFLPHFGYSESSHGPVSLLGTSQWHVTYICLSWLQCPSPSYGCGFTDWLMAPKNISMKSTSFE